MPACLAHLCSTTNLATHAHYYNGETIYERVNGSRAIEEHYWYITSSTIEVTVANLADVKDNCYMTEEICESARNNKYTRSYSVSQIN